MRKEVKENYRVEVTACGNWLDSLDDHKTSWNSLLSLEADIKRHVDFDDIKCLYDTKCVCEYCNADWTEDDDEYNGGCCEKDKEVCSKAVLNPD